MWNKGGQTMKLVNIGFGNLVSADKVVAVVSPESAPIKRMVQEAKERGVLIDATFGRRTKAVLIMDSDNVVLSAILPETVAGRFNGKEEPAPEEESPPPPGAPALGRSTASSTISSAARSSRASSKRGKCWSTPNMWATTTARPASPWRTGWTRATTWCWKSR